MNLKRSLYNTMVNRVPGIKEKYRKKRSRVKGIGRIGIWFYLLGLNLSYYIFRNKSLAYTEKFALYEKKRLYDKGSESSISKREDPAVLADKLAQYDVISFDVFDTLLFRPFSKPADLFFVLGERLEYPDFERIRREMEWKAREQKYKKSRHYEVDLEEIYDLLSEETGIPKETMNTEVELENRFCFANPYMFRVVEELKKRNKRMIITSDMYLNTAQIRELLGNCGYAVFDAYYVSCDMNMSKSEGTLFEEVKKREGKTHSFVHMGDNFIADVEQPKKHGFASEHYVNVNAAGMPYRPEDMSSIIGSAYRGVVNANIHNGWKEYTRAYEFGYIYGGLFVLGYCRFIHEYVKNRSVDKVLFLARDGYILKQVYEQMYPKEAGRLEYVCWSRLAAAKMTAARYKYDYFRRFLYHKANQKYSLEDIFKTMELSDMLEDCCNKAKLTAQTELADRNVEAVRAYLLKHWNQVLAHYEEQLAAGRQYYERILAGCKSVAAVDIGWAGSGAVTLDYCVNQVWKLDCSITGIVAGTNTCHNTEPDTGEPFLQSGRLVSYLYSQRENRDLWKLHDPEKDYNLYWELLLDAPHGSFKGFYLDKQGSCRCEWKEYEEKPQVNEIERGILAFAEDYRTHFAGVDMFENISGRDAYAPMILAMSDRNTGFRHPLSGAVDDANLT